MYQKIDEEIDKKIQTIIEGDYESVLGMKVAIMNAGLMEDIMVHEVFDHNKTFNKAAEAGKNYKKPGE